MVDPQTFELGPAAQAYGEVAQTYLGYGPDPAPRAVVHTCFREAPDSDGDGVPDAAESYPLDPDQAVAEASPPTAPRIDSAPADFSSSTSAVFNYSTDGATGYWCSLDGGAFAACDPSGRSYSSLPEGSHTFTVRALDSLGLVGPPTSVSWSVDTTPPDTNIDSHPDDTLMSGSAEFTFSSNEADTRFACAVDAAEYSACDSPAVLAGLTDGTHTFQVAAIDGAGNEDPTPASFAFTVHTTPDAPTITSGPDEGSVVAATPSFTFDSQYAADYECSFDDEPFAACQGDAAEAPTAPLADGQHSFRVRGIGATGTAGPVTSRSFTVDAVPPDTQITAGSAGEIHVPDMDFAFSASESVSGFYCQLDQGDWVRCDDGTYSRHDLSDGTHTFAVAAVDEVGNQDQTPDQREFTVNTTPTIDAGPADQGTSGPLPSFAFSSPSAASFRCGIDAGVYGRCSGADSYTPATPLSTGWHTFRVRGVTASGRISPAATRRFKVDDVTPPIVTFPYEPEIDAQDASAVVTFDARDPSQPVRTRCSLDRGTWAACASPLTLHGLSAGWHGVRLRARDTWGNNSTAVVRWSQPASG
jgi:hypothetical protein